MYQFLPKITDRRRSLRHTKFINVFEGIAKKMADPTDTTNDRSTTSEPIISRRMAPATLVSLVGVAFAIVAQSGFLIYQFGQLDNQIKTDSARLTIAESVASPAISLVRQEVASDRRVIEALELEYRSNLRASITSDAKTEVELRTLRDWVRTLNTDLVARINHIDGVASARIGRVEDRINTVAMSCAQPIPAIRK